MNLNFEKVKKELRLNAKKRDDSIKALNSEKIHAQEAQREYELRRKINHLKLMRQTMKNQLEVCRRNLDFPKIPIQNKFTQDLKENWRHLHRQEKKLEQKCNRFDLVLVNLGKPWISIVALAMTLCIGLFWVWTTIGIDVIGGNPWQTIVFFSAALMAIDAIGYFAIFGTFASLRNFMKSFKHQKLLEIMIAGGFCVGLVCFFGNILLRILEVNL